MSRMLLVRSAAFGSRFKHKFKLSESYHMETGQYFHRCKQEVPTKAKGVQSQVEFQCKCGCRCPWKRE